MLEPQHGPLNAQSCQSRKHVHVVKHDYHDYATVNSPTPFYEHVLDGGRNHNVFPYRLYEMLQLVERDGLDHIISWQPHGRCFAVHNPEEFAAILPRYFKLSKIASFQRQLNLYGFQRLTLGLDRGGYYNECFLRGKEFLLNSIQRVKVKGTGVRGKSNPQDEPDLYSLAWLLSDSVNPTLGLSVNADHTVIVSDDEQSTEESDSILSSEKRDGTICTWGMTFYYMPRTEQDLPADVWMMSDSVPEITLT